MVVEIPTGVVHVGLACLVNISKFIASGKRTEKVLETEQTEVRTSCIQTEGKTDVNSLTTNENILDFSKKKKARIF